MANIQESKPNTVKARYRDAKTTKETNKGKKFSTLPANKKWDLVLSLLQDAGYEIDP